MNLFVEINLKGENNVVCRERLAIGKLQPATEMQRVLLSVARNGPGFRQRRLGFFRFAVDVDQIRSQAADNVSGRSIDGEDRIQRLGFRA